MSIECSECERDLRGGHAESCSRYISSEDMIERQAIELFRFRAQVATLSRQRDEAVRLLEWLWANCKIVHWPKNLGGYAIEHNPPAGKDMRAFIEAEARPDIAAIGEG